MYSKEIIERAQRVGCKWIATDADGEAWGYMMRPESYIDAWRKDPLDKSVLFQLSIANPAGYPNWLDSLQRLAERPTSDNEAPRDWADAEPLAIADLPPGSKTLYLDVMQRLARAVESGKLPADTFHILWGE